MRAVGIIGYKDSGKTSLVTGLAREFEKKNCRVATIKHIHGEVEPSQTDTAKHGQNVTQVGAISRTGSALFFKRKMSVEDIMGYLDADLILVEGLKNERTYPKVVCLRNGDDAEELFDGLQILVATFSVRKISLDVPVLQIPKDLGRIAEIIERNAFKLPNLDCGGCGYETCYELAKEIVRGEKTAKDCPPLEPEVRISLEGKVLPMNPFSQRVVRNTIRGLLSSLKGFRKGTIQIEMKD